MDDDFIFAPPTKGHGKARPDERPRIDLEQWLVLCARVNPAEGYVALGHPLDRWPIDHAHYLNRLIEDLHAGRYDLASRYGRACREAELARKRQASIDATASMGPVELGSTLPFVTLDQPLPPPRSPDVTRVDVGATAAIDLTDIDSAWPFDEEGR